MGAFRGRLDGRSYRAVKSLFAEGRSAKLVAEEAGGKDRISLNLYRLSDGTARLFPCEMPREKVMRFVEELRLEE